MVMFKVSMSKNSKNIVVDSSHDSHKYARAIPTARWNGVTEKWVIRTSRVAFESLSAVPGVDFEPECMPLLAALKIADEKSWPAGQYVPKTRPYDHQIQGSAKIFARRESAIFAEPGTGKTKMAIDAVSAKYLAGEIDRVLIIAPKSVRAVWVREFAAHSPISHSIELFGAKRNYLRPIGKLLGLVVSSEGMSVGAAPHAAFTFANAGRCALVIDEAHMFKTHNAKRIANALEVSALCSSVTIMTGTPVGNSLVDLYSQFAILNPNIIGYPDFYSFADRYCVFGGFENRKIVGYQNESELMRAIAPYVFRATKAECLSLPPKTYQRRTIEMRPAQSTAYKKLTGTLELEGLQTTNQLDLMLRLHQIAGGFMPSNEGGSTTYKPMSDAKIKELLDITMDCGDQSIVIWCAYRHEVAHVTAALCNVYGDESTVEIHGGIDEAGRARAVDKIQSGAARFLVGIAASGGVGITASRASIVVYYSNNFSYINRVQSEDRVHRIGQSQSVTIIDLVSENTIDAVILQALDAKSDLATWVAANGMEVEMA